MREANAGDAALAPLGAEDFAAARAALAETAERHGLDGLLLLSPASVAYASGGFFSVNERPIGLYVAAGRDPVLFVPDLERENAESAGLTVRCYEEYPGLLHPVLWMIEQTGAAALGIDRLDASLLQAARDRTSRIDLRDHAMEQRWIKSPRELALTRAAARHADAFLAHLLAIGGDHIGQGATEKDLLAECLSHAGSAMQDAHRAAFGGTPLRLVATIHSGPRAALPHGTVLDRKPQPGETLIAGVGACLGGYHAESGATFIVGQPMAEQRRIMATMHEANDAAIEALVPGATCEAINGAALAPIRGAGLKEAIRHRIGHGMGLENHEAPWLAPGDRTAVAPGMVFSNEPGIYRPGRDGWRTINTMIVGETGVEIPSRFLAETPPDARVLAV